MKIVDLLGSIKLGMPQSAGNMTIIPITAEVQDTDISGEMVLSVARDTDYSRLTLKNIDDKPVIVPQGSFFKGKGQDRAMLKASIIGPGSEKTLQVGCVEPSEGGHISIGSKDYTFIPARLRVPALVKPATSYNVIWDDIKKYLEDAGLRGGNAINVFYSNFNKELDEFVAQFEPVDKQIGAIIIINNQIAGIEIYPNYQAWSKVWRLLLRDSYGADAIALIRQKQIAAYKPIIDLDKIEKFEDLEREVLGVKANFITFMKELVDTVLDEEFATNTRETSNIFKVNDVQSQSLIGQMILKNERVVYVSLLANQGQRTISRTEDEIEDED